MTSIFIHHSPILSIIIIIIIFQFFQMVFEKIKVENPVVEMDGKCAEDGCTHHFW